MVTPNGEDTGPRLDKPRQIKYWTRCLKTYLPHHYTSNDSNRLYLAFFILSALDLLGALETASSAEERRDYVNWIYHCQHPDGGFRMWPGTDFGEQRTEENAHWDPANVPATYFALASLLILGDNMARLKRRDTLSWLRKMQREDGSFGETLVQGRIEGGNDPRFGYCAAGIRSILRSSMNGPITIDGQVVEDIDVDGLVKCVRLAESFEGGIADLPFHEPHAGYTFCSLGAMAFMDRLNRSDGPLSGPLRAPNNPTSVLKWLVFLQTDISDPAAGVDSEFNSAHSAAKADGSEFESHKEAHDAMDSIPHQDARDSVGASFFDLLVDGAGMSGRPNKVSDTCYAFWVGACFHIMHKPDMYNHNAVQRYLLGKTQHPVLGGFGKFPGDLPDLYHSYLALAALSLAGNTDVKVLHGGMCISMEASARMIPLWTAWNARWDVVPQEETT